VSGSQFNNSDNPKSSLAFISEYRKLNVTRRATMKYGTDRPEHSDTLREYLAQGMSFAKIAKAVNAKFNTDDTRNAAIGRAKRLGLAGQAPSPTPPRVTAVPQLNRPSEPPANEPRSFAFHWPMPVFENAPPFEPRCVEVEPRHLSLVELEYGDCRHPSGGDSESVPITFCGHPRQPGSSYCTPHFHLSRTPESTEEPAAITARVSAVAPA
jgi:GcrA cell cycle regulator